MPKATISPRAKRLWERLIQWYGARLVDQYGDAPPPDWCDVVDRIDNDGVKRGLSIIRNRYVQHPPTLPQFEQAMKPDTTFCTGPNAAARLSAHVMLHYGRRLTTKQISRAWTYIGDSTGGIAGVVIDADGDHCGYRVMLADLSAPDFKAQPPMLRVVKTPAPAQRVT